MKKRLLFTSMAEELLLDSRQHGAPCWRGMQIGDHTWDVLRCTCGQVENLAEVEHEILGQVEMMLVGYRAAASLRPLSDPAGRCGSRIADEIIDMLRKGFPRE